VLRVKAVKTAVKYDGDDTPTHENVDNKATVPA
jgi:hypothetical protein